MQLTDAIKAEIEFFINAMENDEIEGIGPVKRNSLLAYFGSVDRIKAAAAEELVKVDGITEKNAQNILKYFRG